MSEQLQPAPADGLIAEFRPGKVTIWAWAILSIPLFLIAVGVYATAATHGATHVEVTMRLGDLAAVVALSVAMVCIHEAVHAVVMIAFGASPRFGVLMSSGLPMGFYATSPGYRYTRPRYLIVCLAPLAILSPLGLAFCWLSFGGYLVIPFAIQLAGCIGDVTIAWHVLRAQRGALCEDMRDGTRFWKAQA
jgi:Putative zincin peptidase